MPARWAGLRPGHSGLTCPPLPTAMLDEDEEERLDETALRQLTEMGFPESRASKALRLNQCVGSDSFPGVLRVQGSCGHLPGGRSLPAGSEVLTVTVLNSQWGAVLWGPSWQVSLCRWPCPGPWLCLLACVEPCKGAPSLVATGRLPLWMRPPGDVGSMLSCRRLGAGSLGPGRLRGRCWP